MERTEEMQVRKALEEAPGSNSVRIGGTNFPQMYEGGDMTEQIAAIDRGLIAIASALLVLSKQVQALRDTIG
jgi:hypothetical protein